MGPNIQQIKQWLKEFEFLEFFKEELGWNSLTKERPLVLPHKEQTHIFKPLAHKEKFKIFLYTFQENIPDGKILTQIDRLLDHYAKEHLTIFVDARHENQAWLWVKKGEKPSRITRLNRLNKNQSGELLAQKIARLYVSIEEEDSTTLAHIVERVNLAFDVEKVTARFYKKFKDKHAYFLKHINIPDENDCKWYASIMLNRLMFIYFLQCKRLLNSKTAVALKGEEDYLQNRLKDAQEQDDPHGFYKFLRRLFHEGLNLPKSERSLELMQMIGDIPYVNGGIFDVHILEQRYSDIAIENKVFEELFELFVGFDWYLDDRPMRTGDEINPDVLGYIFEQYINQKQMGAYYTKEDITEYIGKNTIIPFLFEQVARRCPEAFRAGGPVWFLLQANPNEYTKSLHLLRTERHRRKH